VASTGLEDVHSADDVGRRVQLTHRAQRISHELLIVLGFDQHTASFQICHMKVIAIDKNSVSRAAQGWMQGLQALVQVDLDQLLAWVGHKVVDEVGIFLGHGNVVRVDIRVINLLAVQDLF
jgi:hypothetical protein